MAKSLSSLLVLMSLWGCGRPVCFFGIGDCDNFDPGPYQGPDPKVLTLNSEKTEIPSGDKTKLTISGGTAPYDLDFADDPKVGKLEAIPNTSTAWYYAPTVTGETIKVQIKATDKKGDTSLISLKIVPK